MRYSYAMELGEEMCKDMVKRSEPNNGQIFDQPISLNKS